MKKLFSHKKNFFKKLEDLPQSGQKKKQKKLINLLQHLLLWFSLFMAGFIAAKLHSLLG